MTLRLVFSMFLATAFALGCEDDDDSGYLLDGGADGGGGEFDGPNRGFGGRDEDDDSPSDGPAVDSDPAFPDTPPPVPPESPESTDCGSLSCRDVLVGDIVVPPCCPEGPEDVCGLELSVVAGFMPVRGECVAVEQPGNLDPSCPDVLFDDPTERRSLPGCCTAQGVCGVMADLSLLSDFGCVPAVDLLAASSEPPEACTPELQEPEPEASNETGPDAGFDAGEASDAGDAPSADTDASVSEPSDAGVDPREVTDAAAVHSTEDAASDGGS